MTHAEALELVRGRLGGKGRTSAELVRLARGDAGLALALGAVCRGQVSVRRLGAALRSAGLAHGWGHGHVAKWWLR